ncbi:MAG TPA: serine/threonine protein phosphatase, partial [Bacillota bacterium]|nr:serine/threonine protein phosphatase [Bacillota bacterium]
MRKTNSEFNSSFVSEPGTFITNKSYFAFVELDDMACWIAADGLDSDEEKESAQMAVHRIFESFMEKPTISRYKIRQYIQNAHNLLQAESRNVRLKAGLIMLVTDYSKIVWAVAGNARLYHFRRGIYNFRSKDQTLAQLLVDSGKIDEEELNDHEERNNVINYLGKSSAFKPFISRKYRLADGDMMLLCNSGFWENMTVEEINEVLPDAKDAEECVDNLEEMLLGKQNEVLNNYTIAAVYANRVFKETTVDYVSLGKRIAMFALPLLLMLGIGLMINRHMVATRIKNELKVKHEMALKQKKTLDQYEETGDKYVGGEKYQEAVAQYQKALELLVDLNNPKRQEVVKQKNDITMLIIDGDGFYTAKEYPKALESYMNASRAASGFTYDQKGINSRINKTKNIIEAKNLMKQGELAKSRQNYADAKEKFEMAKEIAEQVPDD